MPTPPVDPDYFDKVNYVIDSWARPCDAPWYIYIETMKPAALKAFITLATFGWDDVARGYFRPRGLGARRTGKRKRRWTKALPRFPEMGEEIGKRMPGADEVKGQNWSRLGKTLWRIDSIVQQGLFWWLVADVTIDFAYNWTSVLYETGWCKASDKGRFSFHRDDLALIPNQDWWFAFIGVQDYQFPEPSWSGGTGGLGSNGALIAVAMNFEPVLIPPLPTSYEMRIVDWPSGATLFETGEQEADPEGKLQLIVTGDLGGSGQFRVQVKQNGVAAWYTNAVITGMEN